MAGGFGKGAVKSKRTLSVSGMHEVPMLTMGVFDEGRASTTSLAQPPQSIAKMPSLGHTAPLRDERPVSRAEMSATSKPIPPVGPAAAFQP